MRSAVSIHRIDLSERPASCLAGLSEAGLSEAERARAARLRSGAERRRFIAIRVAVREILGRHLGVGPGTIRFGFGTHGKPELPGVFFNLSHAGDRGLLALGNVPLGIDIEQHAPVDADILARDHFSAAEQRGFSRVHPAERQRSFFAVWTRKEAFIKATGLGVAYGLDRFDVSVEHAAQLRATRPDPGEAAEWHLCDLPAAEGYSAALCVRSRKPVHFTTTVWQNALPGQRR